jgi:hypothetical protein
MTLPIGESYKMDILIKGRKCTHTVVIQNETSENVIVVDFIQKHWLNYDPETKQISFLQKLSKFLL